ncbi:MAG TPA: CBS domain-containing protein [Acidimicrobiia bacterium]|jgi:CBS domain-containing protein|nr:CBS domain-containing protein [Acidimicrobiia bacterium]
MNVVELIGGEVATCDVDTPVPDAARQMIDQDVGSLVVVHNGEAVGIVTERDIMGAVAKGSASSNDRIRSIMTPEPDSVEPDVDVEEAAQWMMAAGYRHMPVMEGSRLLGVVSVKDVLWALMDDRGAGEEGSA